MGFPPSPRDDFTAFIPFIAGLASFMLFITSDIALTPVPPDAAAVTAPAAAAPAMPAATPVAIEPAKSPELIALDPDAIAEAMLSDL
jgi:hypothetical protein